jgi:hypothetical protein
MVSFEDALELENKELRLALELVRQERDDMLIGTPDNASPMVQMSRAIRLTIERQAPTLRELDDKTLRQFMQIVTAFSHDLKDEWERRVIG